MNEILSFETIKSRCSVAKPGTPFPDCYTLYRTIKAQYPTEPIAVIEIGTFTGRGTIALAMACMPKSLVITLDPWSGMSNHGMKADLEVRGMYMNNLAIATANQWIKPGVEVRQIPRSSWDPDAQLKVAGLVAKYDNVFTFIDGHHIYASAKNDFEHFVLPFAKVGSLVAFHDYKASFPGIVRLVNELTMHAAPKQWAHHANSVKGLAILQKIA